MVSQIELGGIVLDVVKKDIKNIHLSVYPPTGRVRLAAPTRMTLDTIRLFAISKLGWIRKQQQKLCEQERGKPARVRRPREPPCLGPAGADATDGGGGAAERAAAPFPAADDGTPRRR